MQKHLRSGGKFTAEPSIYVLAANEWDAHRWMSRQHLFSRLASMGWRIVYSTGPQSFWDRHKPKWSNANLFASFSPAPGVDGELKLDHPGKLLPVHPRLPLLSRVPRYLHARHLRSACEDSENTLLFVTSPDSAPYLSFLRPRSTVFYLHDRYDKIAPDEAAERRRISRMARRSDLLIATGESMLPMLPSDLRPDTRLLAHGVDLDAIVRARELPAPDDIAVVPRPRLGYVGTINDKLDVALLDEVARLRNQHSIVLIGQVLERDLSRSGDLADAFERLRRRHNVYLLGSKPYSEVPRYLCNLDVTLMPFARGSEKIAFSTPTKTMEYFAAGHPVIATPMHSMVQYGDLVLTARTTTEWVDAIDKALGDPDQVAQREKRKNIARENTWDIRADTLDQWLRELIEAPRYDSGP